MVLEQKQKGWNVECGCEKLGGGGKGLVWGRRNARGEEGMKKGRGYWQDGDEDTRTRGERASGKKRTRGYGRGFLIGIDKPTFFGHQDIYFQVARIYLQRVSSFLASKRKSDVKSGGEVCEVCVANYARGSFMVLYVSYLRDKIPRSPVVDIHSSIAFPFHHTFPPPPRYAAEPSRLERQLKSPHDVLC